MTNLNIPAPPSGQRPVDTYQWLGKILEVLGTTKGISWYDNNALNIKQLGDAIGNDINFSETVDRKIADSHLPVQIPAYCDLDTYTTTGLYTSDSDGNTATITNRPPGTKGFILQVYTVWGSAESNRVIQIAYMRSDAMIYTRSKDESGNNWSEWVSYIRSTDVTPNNTGNKVVQRDSSGNFSAGTITASLSGNAKTATTLQTTRNINGTPFNGSGDITTANWGTSRNITIGNSTKPVNGSTNVTWTLSEIGAANASHTHTSAQISDATNANTANMIVKRDASGNFSAGTISASLNGTASYANYMNSNTRMEYGWNGVNYFNISGTAGKAAKVNDTPTTAWWHIMRFNHANSAGFYTDLAVPFNDTSLHYKRVTSGAVQNGGWIKVLDSLNYTSFVPTKTGSGASGTWGISVSGNASTATTLQTARTINGTSFNGAANITTANWGTARNITIGNTTRSVNGAGNVSWTLADIGALPLAGGQLTGNLTFSNSGTSLRGIQGTMANDDCWRVMGGGTATDAGYLEIATCDNGNEPIYVRQYTGSQAFTTIRRTATLLDGSGNTSFPGKVTATEGFSGSLSGNATTASKLQTMRSINGTSFDGSGSITTANWGTARTITIGNTGKSVNGSVGVGWSLAEIGAVPVSTGSSITIHADSDASSTGEYLLLKAGHNELKIASSAGGGTVTKSNTNLTYNGNQVYHAGNKPTAAAIGAASATHNHGLLHDTLGTTLPDTTTDNGWGMINNTYNGYLLKSIRGQEKTPNWFLNDYSAGIAFGGSDTHGVMSVKYNNAQVKFAGGNGTHPRWWFDIGGASGKSYNLDQFLLLSGGTLTGTLTGIDIKANNFIPVGPNLHLRGSGTNYDQGTIVLFTSPRPATNGGQILGSTNYRFGSVWCTQGVFNGSDSKLKENIKLINKKVYTSNLDNDNVTMEELYTYIKESNLYTYNFKKSTENVVGILADELPDNIFNKIGVISKTEEEYIEEVEQQKRCIELLNTPRTLNLTDEDVVEEVGITYEEFKEVINKEIEEPVRLINAPAQVAMIQGVLGMALNKLEYAENEISDLRSEVAELKALVNQLISK